MKEYNIIGDIAGQYETLLALLAKMPKVTPLSVGDMIDRGPQSKEVLEFFMKEGEAILGNHDHMMLSTALDDKYYNSGVWTWNGGDKTLFSLFPQALEARENVDVESEYYYISDLCKKITKEYPDIINWFESLPLYKELDAREDKIRGFVSHAVKRPDWSIETATRLGPNAYTSLGSDSIIWNRGQPRRMDGFYQICGHNSQWGLKSFTDKQGEYGKCIDTSRTRILTGVHWPSMEVFQQEYLE